MSICYWLWTEWIVGIGTGTRDLRINYVELLIKTVECGVFIKG